MVNDMICKQLVSLANKYETEDFLRSDPSQFMHYYADAMSQERAAFVASALSYGNRKQFMPKINTLLTTYMTNKKFLPDTDDTYYRLHTNRMVNHFLHVLDTLYADYGSMRALLETNDIHTGMGAIRLITAYFFERKASDLVPKNERSACKRLCMFLRWMVRNNSPVDLGLWSDVIDSSTLIIPLDTHVLKESQKLGLIKSKGTTMSTALQLTERLREFFPTDPLRADFALFGMGIDQT